MYFGDRPQVIEAEVWAVLPDRLRHRAEDNDWVKANRLKSTLHSLLESPSFDGEGGLYLVDVPYGRILHVDRQGNWEVALEYDGEPNAVKRHPDGRWIVTDYRRGLLEFSPTEGSVKPILARRNSESFKGLNDLAISSAGDVYFTDQGQTGLHDPTGRVYRLAPDGKLDLLLSNVPSPNGVVLDSQESALYIAATRDNSVWRAPLTPDGGVTKVGRFCSMFGAVGPDGLAMDADNNLFVAHASLGEVLVFSARGELVTRVISTTGAIVTNLAFDPSDLHCLYITEAQSGSILRARLPYRGISLPRKK
ncbi:MAG: gluconolactonase [Rhizobiales bacterium 65-9]|nr:SMP-30/gluconolactonase/LRE family protein [Hyphomicrobiales bacterium]OJY32783.1 MAG: gluconolactonase [Rhizobiales bacterium 65-9]